MKISEAITQYLTQFELSGIKNTEENYKIRYREFREFIIDNYGDIDITELNAQMINAFQMYFFHRYMQYYIQQQFHQPYQLKVSKILVCFL